MTSSLLWAVGFIAGALLFTLASILFTFKLILQPKLYRKLPQLIKANELSQSVIEEIRRSISGHPQNNANTESIDWLNGIVNWTFLNLSDTLPVKRGIRQIISEIVVDIRRGPLGYFIKNSELLTVEIGGCAPKIEMAKIITGSSLKEPTSKVPLTLQFDLNYDEGDCKVQILIETIFNRNIKVDLRIKTFKGSICLVIQEKTIHFCFIGEPSQLEIQSKLSFFGKSQINYEIPFLNYLISSEKLIKKGIATGCTFPKFLNQWYRAGPEQPPYPWDSRLKTDPELLYNWK